MGDVMSREEIIEKLKEIMKKYSFCVSEAWLFGSFARENYHRTSDIDIAINCSDYHIWFDIVNDIEGIETIRRFDILNLYDGEFVFDIKEIKENGIKLCG